MERKKIYKKDSRKKIQRTLRMGGRERAKMM
jgi:hypothetical protein